MAINKIGVKSMNEKEAPCPSCTGQLISATNANFPNMKFQCSQCSRGFDAAMNEMHQVNEYREVVENEWSGPNQV